MKNILKQALIESIKTKRDLQNEQFTDIFELIGNLLVKCIINKGMCMARAWYVQQRQQRRHPRTKDLSVIESRV